MNGNKARLKIIIRYFVGFVFIASAMLKLISIDTFEIYVYSFGFLELNYALIAARLVISLEIFLGVLLISGIYLKKTISFSIVLLVLFSGFILYLFFSNNEEHCHCFGDFIEMSHSITLLKNGLLIALLLFIYKAEQLVIKNKKMIVSTSFILSLLFPFFFSPPHTFFKEKYSKNSSYDEVVLQQFLDENKAYSEGKQILCFFGTGCKYCKLATKKISVIANKLNNKDLVKIVFWGTEESVTEFYKETNSTVFEYSFLSPNKFLRITDGKMPLIILLENGVVKSKFGYGSIDETAIVDFITE